MEYVKMENSLSKTEKQVIDLVKQDYEVKEIAEKLGISSHTVKSYISKLSKMNII